MKPIVTLQNVYKTYSLGSVQVPALQNLNFEILEGEFTALIGASGSGKTTLLNLVGLLDVPDKGVITIDQEKVSGLNEDEKSHFRNLKIGYIFQSFNLIPVLSVFENVELPLLIQKEMSKAERDSRVVKALTDVGLADYFKHRPDQLSGGQRQRVAIARALVTKPKLILADEPTANLDSGTAGKIIDLLIDLNTKQGVTFLFCSHDEKLIGRVKRIARIHDGIIH